MPAYAAGQADDGFGTMLDGAIDQAPGKGVRPTAGPGSPGAASREDETTFMAAALLGFAGITIPAQPAVPASPALPAGLAWPDGIANAGDLTVGAGASDANSAGIPTALDDALAQAAALAAASTSTTGADPTPADTAAAQGQAEPGRVPFGPLAAWLAAQTQAGPAATSLDDAAAADRSAGGAATDAAAAPPLTDAQEGDEARTNSTAADLVAMVAAAAALDGSAAAQDARDAATEVEQAEAAASAVDAPIETVISGDRSPSARAEASRAAGQPRTWSAAQAAAAGLDAAASLSRPDGSATTVDGWGDATPAADAAPPRANIGDLLESYAGLLRSQAGASRAAQPAQAALQAARAADAARFTATHAGAALFVPESSPGLSGQQAGLPIDPNPLLAAVARTAGVSTVAAGLKAELGTEGAFSLEATLRALLGGEQPSHGSSQDAFGGSGAGRHLADPQARTVMTAAGATFSVPTAAMPSSMAADVARALPDDVVRGTLADSASLTRSVVQTARFQARQGGGEAHIKLNPEHLGELSVLVKIDGSVVSATLRAESPLVRSWIESHQQELRAALKEQGLVLDSLVVDADGRSGQEADAQAQAEQQRQMSGRRQSTGPQFEAFL
jgi:hypothetical protein